MAAAKSYDTTVVKEVRNKALGDILEVLNETPASKKFPAYKREMLLKLANTVLPRVQEHGGLDGENIKITFDNVFKGADEEITPLQ